MGRGNNTSFPQDCRQWLNILIILTILHAQEYELNHFSPIAVGGWHLKILDLPKAPHLAALQ